MPVMNLTTRKEFSCWPADAACEAHVLLQLEFPGAADVTTRPPLHLALVLDRSSSMSGEKLEAAKECAVRSLNWLTRRDFLTVVAYASDVTLLVPHAALTNKSYVAERIRSVQANGSTNLSGGWLKALGELRAHFDPAHLHRVLLLTDGQANEGITVPAELASLASRYRQNNIQTSTLGFGSDFSEGLLVAVAEAGAGRFHYVKEVEGLASAFHAEFGELTALVAQNLELRVETDLPVSLVGASIGPHDGTPGRLTVVPLGDVRAGDLKQLVLRVRLSPVGSNGKGPSHLRLVARCDDVRNPLEPVVEYAELDFPRGSVDAPPLERDNEVWREVWWAEVAGLKLKAAGLLGTAEAFSAAAALRKHVVAAQSFLKDPTAMSIREECARLDELARQIEEGSVDASVAKQVAHETLQLRTQRGAYRHVARRKHIRAQISPKQPEEAEEVVNEVVRTAAGLGFADDRQYRIRLALNELLDNAFQHGCKDRTNGVIGVECDLTEGYARLIVTDDGPGFDAEGTLAEEERTCTTHRKRGRGLLLVRRLANRFEIDTRQGTRIEVVLERAALGLAKEAPDGLADGGVPSRAEGKAGRRPSVLRVTGSLDGSRLGEFRHAMDALVARGENRIVLDFEELTYANSTAIGTLLHYADELQSRGGNLVIANVSSKIRVVFDMLGFASLIPICHGLAEAAEFFT